MTGVAYRERRKRIEEIKSARATIERRMKRVKATGGVNTSDAVRINDALERIKISVSDLEADRWSDPRPDPPQSI